MILTKEQRLKILEEEMADTAHEELIQALVEYREKFKSTFPTYGFSGKHDEMLPCIRDCIEHGKDVYEMGYMPDPADIGAMLY